VRGINRSLPQNGVMSTEIPKEELEKIKEECLLWANNCGGCETCARFFANPPLYSHQETFYLICMIEKRDEKIAELEKELKTLRPA
jgi:hypothetical protein